MKIYKRVMHKYFEAVMEGKKKFEIRLANFKLVLQEQKEGAENLTGRKLEFEILFTMNTKDAEKFWTKKKVDKYGLVILSLQRKYTFK